MKFKCQNCGHLIELPDVYAGTDGMCPKCNNNIIIPEMLNRNSNESINNHTPTSAMAIASLVLGGCSIIFSFITAIPGLILGIIALVVINRGERKGRGIAITGIILNSLLPAVVGLFIIAMTLPSLSLANEKAHRIKCASNLKQVGLAMITYWDENMLKLPNQKGKDGLNQLGNSKSFQTLINKGSIVDKKIFHCPACKSNKSVNSYIYLGNAYNKISILKLKRPQIYPLAFDRLQNHKNFVNILFLDGHVQGFEIDDSVLSALDVISMLNNKYKYPPLMMDVLSDKSLINGL